VEHQSGWQSWHLRSRWRTALGDQVRPREAAAVEHEQAVGAWTGKRGMDFDAEVTNLTMGCSGQAWLGGMHQLNACCTRAFVSGVQKLMICSMPFWVFHDRQWPASRLHAHLLAGAGLPRRSVTSPRGGLWAHDRQMARNSAVIMFCVHAGTARGCPQQRWRGR
jgi:hypothetical protein